MVKAQGILNEIGDNPDRIRRYFDLCVAKHDDRLTEVANPAWDELSTLTADDIAEPDEMA